jgi:two-component system, cell cycle response regulator DivK
VAQVAIGFTPRLLQGLERSQLSAGCAKSRKFRWRRRVPASQEIDVSRHFLQDTHMTLRLGNEPGVKGSNGSDVTIAVVEVLVATRGAHKQSKRMPLDMNGQSSAFFDTSISTCYDPQSPRHGHGKRRMLSSRIGGLLMAGHARRPHRPSTISVLVVDDYDDGRELVVEYLSFRGFVVHAASGGAEAVEIARTVKPQIVLMDLSMPGLDGWDATRLLKNDPETQAITVIALTAHALQRETESARQAGCDGVISKPFDLTTLADVLPRVLTEGPKALEVEGLSLNALRADTRSSSGA